MKNKIIYFILLGILVFGCCKNDETKSLIKEVEIPFLYSSKDVIIVNSEHFYKTSWEISESDVITILETINNFFEDEGNVEKNDLNGFYKIKASRFNYKVQLVGYLEDGRKKVFCNFYPRLDDYYQLIDENPLDKKAEYSRYNTLYFVEDGGHYFWRVKIDLANKECFEFSINGEA